MSDVRLNRDQMRGYLSLVEAGKGSSSVEIAQMLAREGKRLPTPRDHETVMVATGVALKAGLVSARPALTPSKGNVYASVSLTEDGESRLHRLRHPRWWLSVVYEEVKDFAARVVGSASGP
jgi:hypothetical protein